MAEPFRLSLNPPTIAVRTGDSTQTTLTIQNVGDTVDTYALEILGLDPSWLFVDGEPHMSLLPGKQADLRIIIQPPPVPTSRAGVYRIGVRVTRTNDPAQQGMTNAAAYTYARPGSGPLVQDTATLDMNLMPVPDFTLEMAPRYLDSRRNRKAQISISNGGNLDMLFSVSANDPANELDYRHPAQVGVLAGEREVFSFETAARNRKLIGGKTTTDFQLNVQPTQLPGMGGSGTFTPGRGTPFSMQTAGPGVLPKSIAGRYTDTAPIPGWLLPMLLVLLIAVAAGAIVLAGIVKQPDPQIAIATARAVHIEQSVAAIGTANFITGTNTALAGQAITGKANADATITALVVSGSNSQTIAAKNAGDTAAAGQLNGAQTSSANTAAAQILAFAGTITAQANAANATSTAQVAAGMTATAQVVGQMGNNQTQTAAAQNAGTLQTQTASAEQQAIALAQTAAAGTAAAQGAAHNATVTAQVGLTQTAAAHSTFLYDFIAKANTVTWQSIPTGANLPFPGSDIDDRGFVLWRDNYFLNDSTRPARVLETHPRWVANGGVSGCYIDLFTSGYVIAPTDHISGKIGFIYGAGAGDVTFKILLRTQSSGNQEILSFPLAYAQGTHAFDIPIGSRAGQRADVCLTVNAGATAAQDWAAWQDLKITR